VIVAKSSNISVINMLASFGTFSGLPSNMWKQIVLFPTSFIVLLRTAKKNVTELLGCLFTGALWHEGVTDPLPPTKNVSRVDTSSEKNPSQAIFPALELQPTRELTILWGVFRSV